ETLELLRAGAAKYPVGEPTAEGTRVGPLANAAQYEKVVGFISSAVEDVATLSVGGRPVHLRHLGRGHTDSDLVVLLPDAHLLLAGDLVEEGAPPQFGDGFPLDSPATLDALLALVTGPVVPGHGAVVDKAFVAAQRAEVARLAEVARAGHAEGRPAADAARDLPYFGEHAEQAVERAYLQLQ
ncbi:MAG TPA: aldehyde dehydrogenase family protein, partial [Mycobacteriales bacterium]|nr:aldehyde dehydrogenase family protein [Mycobacteriales bacterium]